VGFTLALAGQLRTAPLIAGGIGLLAIGQGAFSPRRLWYGMLLAAVCWTVGWALATGS
jgi:hypothetical protein